VICDRYPGALDPHPQRKLSASIGKTTANMGLRDGRATCHTSCCGFLGKPKGSQPRCFVDRCLLLGLVGRHDFHMYCVVSHLELDQRYSTRARIWNVMTLSLGVLISSLRLRVGPRLSPVETERERRASHRRVDHRREWQVHARWTIF